jgi:hypothetical protein
MYRGMAVAGVAAAPPTAAVHTFYNSIFCAGAMKEVQELPTGRHLRQRKTTSVLNPLPSLGTGPRIF